MRSANPDVADPARRALLLTIPHAEAGNHNGGQLQFGPDGKLWLATGDGGGGDDQFGHAQDPNSLLGKLIRLDPAAPAPEVVARGLRNPWRFSFDRATGQIVIADVGQGAVEEVNVGARGQLRLAVLGGDDAADAAIRRATTAAAAGADEDARRRRVLLDHRRLRGARPRPADARRPLPVRRLLRARRCAPSTSRTRAATRRPGSRSRS